jgi:hypothetical protein
VACDCMGCMGSMASTSIDTMAATSGDEVVVAPRRRGKSKAPNFTYDGPVAVIRLELDGSDDRVRRRLERQWEAVFRLRRALQRDAPRGAGRTGRPATNGQLIPKRCGHGWACPAKVLKPQQNVIFRPVGGCVSTSPKRLACMWPTRCGRRSSGICSPTRRGADTVRRGLVRGGISPASPAAPVHTPKTDRRGRPTVWWERWMGTWPPTGTGNCPLGCAPRIRRRPRCPNTACADTGSPRPWTSAPTTAGTAGCAATATSSPRCWLPAWNSPTRKTRAPRPSTTNLPTPCAMGWPPSKSGRVQSTGTSHHHHRMRDRPGPAATTRWPLLNKQHPAHPRTDQDPFLDVAGPAENNQHPS